jgi:1,4-dihydroxy-6-naphthoate synthase
LGGNVIKRDLGREMMVQVGQDIRKSIQYGLDHREEATSYAMQFSRGLDPQKADRFIGMYVNDLTLDYGTEGRDAVRRILDEAHRQGIIPNPVTAEFV